MRQWLVEAQEIPQAIRRGVGDALLIHEDYVDKLVALKSFDELAADNAEVRSQIAERARIEAALHATQEELRALIDLTAGGAG